MIRKGRGLTRIRVVAACPVRNIGVVGLRRGNALKDHVRTDPQNMFISLGHHLFVQNVHWCFCAIIVGKLILPVLTVVTTALSEHENGSDTLYDGEGKIVAAFVSDGAKGVVLVIAVVVLVDPPRHVWSILQHGGAAKNVCHAFWIGALFVRERRGFDLLCDDFLLHITGHRLQNQIMFVHENTAPSSVPSGSPPNKNSAQARATRTKRGKHKFGAAYLITASLCRTIVRMICTNDCTESSQSKPSKRVSPADSGKRLRPLFHLVRVKRDKWLPYLQMNFLIAIGLHTRMHRDSQFKNVSPRHIVL